MSISTAAASVLAHLREHGVLRLDDPPALRLQIALLEDEVRTLRAETPARPAPPPPRVPDTPEPPPAARKPKEGLPFRVRSATEPFECSLCGVEKPHTDFPNQNGLTNEHRRKGTVCKACQSERAKEWYQAKKQPAQRSGAELLALPPTTELLATPSFQCQGCLSTAFTEHRHHPGLCIQCVDKMKASGPVLNGAAQS